MTAAFRQTIVGLRAPGDGRAVRTWEAALTMIHPPRPAAAGAGPGPGRRAPAGRRIAGFSIRGTAGGYLRLLRVRLIPATGLPPAAPGWPGLAYLGVPAAPRAGVPW